MNKFLETSAILQQMSTVLTKNQIDFTQTGIEKNLNTWDFNKNPMLYHFRNCNTWNKEHLAIVTTIESSEQTDSNNEFFKLWGILYQEHLDLRLGHVVLLSDFHVLFLKNKNERYPTLHIEKFIEDERAIDYINQHFECVGVKVVKGQKLSKVLSKIFSKTGVDKATSYQKIFAKMSDLVNHGNEKSAEQLIISLHPCDYLTMSNGNSWTSCHSLKNKSTGNSLPVRQAGGEYSAGTLSYMNDTCTTVAYTLARKPAVNEPLWHVPKKSRVVIYFDFPVGFFVGKIYLPVRQAGGDSSQFTVANFAETIGECLKPAFDCTSDNAKFHRLEEHKVHKTPYSLHYIDYCVTFTVNSQKTIDCETGQPAYCVECGKRLEKSNKLSCCLSADRQAMKLLTVIVANNLRKSGICRLLATFGFAIIAINLALIVAKNLIGQPTLGLIWITVIGNLGKMSSFANIALAKISNG